MCKHNSFCSRPAPSIVQPEIVEKPELPVTAGKLADFIKQVCGAVGIVSTDPHATTPQLDID